MFLAASIVVYKSDFDYAYIPAEEKIINAKSRNVLTGLGNEFTEKSPLLHEDLLSINEDYLTFWVDEEAGFTEEEQEALIKYLLSLKLEK